MSSDVNLRVIQKYLGHSNIATTTWYSHTSIDDLRRAQNNVSGPVDLGKK